MTAIDARDGRIAGALMLGAGLVLPLLPGHPGIACPLRTLTSVPCPLCGMTTSVEDTLHLDIRAALAANPAGVAAVLAAIAILLVRPTGVRLHRLAPAAMLAMMWLFELHRFGFLEPRGQGDAVSDWSTDVAAGQRAGFGSRFVAYLIDWIILAVLYVIALVVVGTSAAYAVYVLAGFAYFGYFEGSPSGQTPGKRALGIRVYDFRRQQPAGSASAEASSVTSASSFRASRARSATSGCSGTRRSRPGTTRSRRRSSCPSRSIPWSAGPARTSGPAQRPPSRVPSGGSTRS